jgi:Pilus assembly protein, PilO
MLQTRTTRWLAGTALLCVALLAGAYLLLIGPKRAEAASRRDENAAAQQRNDTLQIQIAQLRAQFARLPERQSELADILAQMPPTADVPKLVRDVDALAKDNGVTLTSVTPGTASYLAAPSAGSATAPVTGSAVAPATGSAPSAAGTLGQVAQIPLTLVLHGDFYAQLSFLKQLQHSMSRAVLLTGLQFTGAQTGAGPAGQVDVTLTGSVFALPAAAAALAATSSSPAPSASTGTGSTGTGS